MGSSPATLTIFFGQGDSAQFLIDKEYDTREQSDLALPLDAESRRPNLFWTSHRDSSLGRSEIIMEAKENCSFMRGNSMSEKGFNRFCKTTISLFLLALVFILAPASGWASDNRVQQRQAILVICDYLEMDDLSKPELIHLHNFLEREVLLF